MSTPIERLSAWFWLRRWSILGGLAPLILGLLAFGLATHDWIPVAGGVGGLVLGAVGVTLLVMYPHLWEPHRRWKTFAVWMVAGTALIVLVVAVVFLST